MNRVIPASGWLPHPTLSAILLVLWILLWQSLDAGLVLAGALLAFVIPLWTRIFWPDRPDARLRAVIAFLPIFLWDIVIANMVVARLILDPRRKLRPTWVVVPLEVRDPYAITTLANVISLTPGTVSSRLSADRRRLLVHVLDVESPATAVERIKLRYEARIKEIFE